MKIDCQKGLQRAIMSMKADDVEELIIRNLPVLATMGILEDINKTERKNIIAERKNIIDIIDLYVALDSDVY